MSYCPILHFHVSHFQPPPWTRFSTDFNALYYRHKRAEQRAPGTTGIQTKAPLDKTHFVYLVADMVMLCGRYGLGPSSEHAVASWIFSNNESNFAQHSRQQFKRFQWWMSAALLIFQQSVQKGPVSGSKTQRALLCFKAYFFSQCCCRHYPIALAKGLTQHWIMRPSSGIHCQLSRCVRDSKHACLLKADSLRTCCN